jgi:xanthine dehydrogenase YagS FAD-binding subunit
MRPFSYVRAGDAGTAIALVRARPDSAFLAGGTTEVDLVRQDVLRPGLLVDINDLPLDLIEDLPDGGLRIGALARPRVASAPRPLADGHQLVAFGESHVPKTIVITGPAIRVVPREADI